MYSRLDKETIIDRLQRSDLLVTDLDGTLASSPAKMVMRSTLTSSHASFPLVAKWISDSVRAIAKNKVPVKTAIWQSYVDHFLTTDEHKEYVTSLFTPEVIEGSVIPGVKEFLAKVRCEKTICTRSTWPIAQHYCNYLTIGSAWTKSFNKKQRIETIVHYQKRIILMGDSKEDEEALDVLRHYESTGKIEYALGIYVTKDKVNSAFDVNVFRDYTPLADLLE